MPHFDQDILRPIRLAGLCLGSAFSVVIAVSHSAGAAEPSPVVTLGEGGFPIRNSIDYQFHDSPENSGGSPILTENRESGQFIVSKTPTDTWAVQERFSHFNLSAPVVIPQTSLSLPTSLWSLEGGASYGHHLENGRTFGFNVNAGSSSDRLFYSVHEIVYSANASYRVPSGDPASGAGGRNAWLFFLNYSNNRHFLNNVPLPGIAYYFNSLEGKLKAILGFPFASLFYTPTPDWSLQAGLFGPRRLNMELGYRAWRPVQVYAGFDWSPLEWERSNRDDNSNRLFFDKKRLMVGARSPLFDGVNLDLSGGREFDRRFFENDSSSTRDVTYASLPASWYFEARLSYRFGTPRGY